MKIWKRLAALTLCAALTAGTALAANTVYRTITVEYSGIKLVIDGVEITPKDVNGTTVEPFIYNGTTYLPVRAVGNAIGKQVTWDGENQTIYLGDVPGETNTTFLNPYDYRIKGYTKAYNNDATKTFSMMGDKYTQGVTFWGGGSAYFNLNGLYSSVSFDVGHLDNGWSNDCTLFVYADDDIVAEIELSGDMQTTHHEIDVSHALQMRLIVEGSSGEYGDANIIGIK